MAFFLLSGFLIHANERHRLGSDRTAYLLRRGLRVYPTLLFAMGVSIVVASQQGELDQRFDTGELLCTLFALQDAAALKPGTICRPFMGNSPLWSLSYDSSVLPALCTGLAAIPAQARYDPARHRNVYVAFDRVLCHLSCPRPAFACVFSDLVVRSDDGRA